jgi:hypothetical protein
MVHGHDHLALQRRDGLGHPVCVIEPGSVH